MDTANIELERFLRAQELDYPQALAELQAGRKRSHWIWYVLPQLRGLGRSEMAHMYGLEGRDEALAYLNHPVLGLRLCECVGAMLRHRQLGAVQILGEGDAMKFRSCLTLFAEVGPENPLFAQALEAFYGGAPDPETLRLLGPRAAPQRA